MEDLRFIDGVAAEEDKYFWSSGYNKKLLFDEAAARLYVDGRRVDVPGGFQVEVDRPKGRKGYYPVVATLSDETLYALEAVLRDGREVTVEYRVDGERTVYLVRAVNMSGRLNSELVEGEPMIWKQGKRV